MRGAGLAVEPPVLTGRPRGQALSDVLRVGGRPSLAWAAVVVVKQSVDVRAVPRFQSVWGTKSEETIQKRIKQEQSERQDMDYRTANVAKRMCATEHLWRGAR